MRLYANHVLHVFDRLEHLQSRTDESLELWSSKAVCSVAVLTVYESWERELEHLAHLLIFPEPFNIPVTCPVYPDRMVHFENHSHPVPFIQVGEDVSEINNRKTL